MAERFARLCYPNTGSAFFRNIFVVFLFVSRNVFPVVFKINDSVLLLKEDPLLQFHSQNNIKDIGRAKTDAFIQYEPVPENLKIDRKGHNRDCHVKAFTFLLHDPPIDTHREMKFWGGQSDERKE